MSTKVRNFKIGNLEIGGKAPLFLIAGPCVIESEKHCLDMAEKLAELTGTLDIPFIFKSSYDKANRTSVTSYRGPGLQKGLAILQKVKTRLNVPIISDIHTENQAQPAAEVLDCLQLPAFLSRQTDLLLAAGKTGKPVALKKGQFLAPWDIKTLVEKIESTGNNNIMLIERGFTFGYNNLVSDMRSLAIIREAGVPVVFDATHSVQLPGGAGDTSGGEGKFVPLLSRAAAAAGIDGLFLEVHDNPENAPCDGPNMVPFSELKELLITVKAIAELVDTP